MAVAELDVVQLSSYCSLPQQSIKSLLDAPTAELVQSLLINVAAKAREHRELTSEKLKLGVELENAVRGGETKNRVLKGSIDKSLRDAADLRQKLQAEIETRSSVETELERLKSSTLESSSELSGHRSRISALESSNRDTLSLLESKTTAYDGLAEELNAQHQTIIKLRREVTTLEQSVQSANAASTSARFHEQGLQQEIESLKRNNDWLDKELKTKSAEYTKYRKEKSLRIAELQRQYDEAQSAVDSANRTETNLRRRLEEIGQKADESFSKTQQMQEDFAKKDEAFRVELEAASRLTELTRSSANTERRRQQDLSAQLESAKEEAAEQLGTLGAELETEHRDREAADAKIAELEVQIEQLEASLSASQSRRLKDNSPHQGINGFATPVRGTSTPMGSPSSSRSKGGLSITQMYSNYNDLKAEHEFEKRRNEKLSSTLDDMIQDLETRQPEIEELRADHGRLELEIAEMSTFVDVIGKERDQAVRGARKWEGELEAKTREGEVLRQQLRDLSSQVKVFLMEDHLRDQGHSDLSPEARAQLEQLAQGQMDGGILEGMTDTDRFISESLVTFRTISEMQEQNTNLLKITRELGEKMEREESTKKHLEGTRNWDDLQHRYERCKDEVKSLMTQSQSYVRERDMFRRMLAHRGQLPAGGGPSSLFDDSVNGDADYVAPRDEGVVNSIEDFATSKDLADYAKLYKDMQTHFDAYRNEAATDRSTLKGQVDSLSKLNGELRSDVARGNSQVTLAHERYEMLQANYSMLRTENVELKKRSQALSDGAAKQELRVQQVAEDLVEAKGLVESMRNEAANLKAVNEFWKTVEKRITEDNATLLDERNRLNALNANLQNLLNEREHSDIEARRRLQTQVDNLEREHHTANKRLTEATEENKSLSQRREYDNGQSQKRVDDLVASLSSIREQLIAANTTKDHLSGRVDQLTIELRSAEERVNALQSTPKACSNGTGGDDSQETSVHGETSMLNKEQDAAVHVSELKRDLDLTNSELGNLRDQVQQYKAISQASEEELLSLTETHDLYRSETDKLIEEKDVKIKELEQRVEDTSSALASTNTELSNLRNEQAENHRRLEDQKKAFEAEYARLKDQDDRHSAAAQYYQEDLKAQADIAQQAQQNYETELVKHADAAKALQKVRTDYNALKLEIVEVKTEAESARTSLTQSEESWMESRQRYEREMADLQSGRASLTAQNSRLHQQLEDVTSQISSLRKHVSGDDEVADEQPPASGLDNLQEVIKYLRREKEIVDVQLELSTQEGKRLKQQLDYAQSQLDDTRLRLNQQRRAEADSERSALDHNKLMETINELNTFRESSVTLRAESRQAQAALAARTAEADELKAQVEPLRAEILELKNERETQEGETRLQKENADRWQQRAQNVLQKYDRVDPAELEALKEQLKALEAERDELIASRQILQEQAETTVTQIAQVQEQSNEKIETMRTRLTDQFKARSKTLSDRIKEKDAALQTAATEKQGLEQQLTGLSALQAELESARAERDVAIEKAASSVNVSHSINHNGSEDGQLGEDEHPKPAQEESQPSQSANLQSQLDASKSKISELEAEMKRLQEEAYTAKAELAQLQATPQQGDDNSNNELQQQLENLRNDLVQSQQDVQTLRTAAAVNAPVPDAPAENGPNSIADQVAERVDTIRAELEARHEEQVKQTTELSEKRTSNMKAQLSRKLAEGRAEARQIIAAEHEQVIQKLKSEHEEDMSRLMTRHKDELDELQRNADSRLIKIQAIGSSEHGGPQSGDGGSDIKPEGETQHSPWQPSEAEARAFLQSNETARNMVRKTVTSNITKAKDELSTQLKAEHEKSMLEYQNKANTAKEHAVMMEGKKTALQVNMANNKARISQFRLGVVEKAAQETPQKAVEEVWTVAKDAKPPPPTAPQPQQQAHLSQQKPGAAISSQSTTSASNAAAQQPPLRPTPVQATQGTTSTPPKAAQPDQQGQQPRLPALGRATPAAAPPQAQSATEQQRSPQQQLTSGQTAFSNTTTPNQTASLQQQKPSHNTTHHPNNSGIGSGVLRGLQQSGLPIARGGSMRGNPNVRGRGSGIDRQQGSRPGQGQQQDRSSPTRGGMNPGAKQFVPGSKRPRDEEQQGGDAGNGKRIRGGGGP